MGFDGYWFTCGNHSMWFDGYGRGSTTTFKVQCLLNEDWWPCDVVSCTRFGDYYALRVSLHYGP
jgi:hypothetical protein